MTDDEVALPGGNVTLGVVRVGATVRRPQSPHAPAVHRLLRHLETAGLPTVPRLLGTDAQGREMLTLLPGSPEGPAHWSDAALDRGGRMLRALHDATAGLDFGTPADWAIWTDPAEVIGHSDLAPYNMLFDGDLPTGIVDFDLAGPAPRLRDLAYLAWWVVPLAFAGDRAPAARADAQDGHRRLRRLARAYGTTDLTGLADQVARVLSHMADPAACARMIGAAAADRLAAGGHFAEWARQRDAFRDARGLFAGLTSPGPGPTAPL